MRTHVIQSFFAVCAALMFAVTVQAQCGDCGGCASGSGCVTMDGGVVMGSGGGAASGACVSYETAHCDAFAVRD